MNRPFSRKQSRGTREKGGEADERGRERGEIWRGVRSSEGEGDRGVVC